MSPDQSPLTVVIIGAGLAGTLAARVLREKHNVKIYERMLTPVEAGAAINIGPNGVQILDTLHFDRSNAGSLAVCGTRVYDKDGDLKMDKYNNYMETYGSDWLFQHRADLRAEFLRMATAHSESSGIPGQPAQVYWNCPVTEVDPEGGKIILASGEEITADLIIGDQTRSFHD